MNYQYRRACKCGNVDFIDATKTEAAFELNFDSIIENGCSKCGGKKVWSIGISNSPEIDEELLSIWSKEPEYLFCEQDQDLMLAQYKNNIDLYLKYIDDESISIGKRNVLIEALCVMIYDRAKKTDKENLNLINRIASELRKRERLVLEAQYWIMDYIKKVSFPIIGIEFFVKEEKSELSNEPKEKNKLEKESFWNRIKQFWN